MSNTTTIGSPAPGTRVWLVSVEEHSDYTAKIDETVLDLPADAHPNEVRRALSALAEQMVKERHPDVVRDDVVREAGAILPRLPFGKAVAPPSPETTDTTTGPTS